MSDKLISLTTLIEQGKNISILSQGGTGKSTLISAVQKQLEDSLKFDVTSTTGVSAYLIGGRTIHSFCGIGVLYPKHTVQDTLKKIKKNKDAKNRLFNCQLLVIDEISMMGGSYFDRLNEVCKVIRGNDKPFGGIQMIVTGDFYQLPPIDDMYCFESKSWAELGLHPIVLEKVYRYTDEAYAGILSRVRKAAHTPDDIVELFKRVKAYNELHTDALEIQPTFLTSKRIDVDEKNNDELAKNPNETVFYRSSDDMNGDLLEGVAPSVLKLKVGAQVMLTVNVDVEGGLTNGARGVVTQLGSDHISVKFKNGRSVPFERHPYMIEEDKKVMAKRAQFPICLAYCLSIHKSQGSTLDCAVIEAGNSIFSHHSVYVALSRVRSLDGLYLKNFNPYKITVDPRVVAFYASEK